MVIAQNVVALDRSWEGLPPRLGTALRPLLPALAGEIIQGLHDAIPDYTRPLEGEFGRGVRLGVEVALGQFVDMVEAGPGASPPVDRSTYRSLGRGEMGAGRSLDALQAAYRLGARISWRHFSAAAQQAGFGGDVLIALAEAIFAYIDELAAASVEGFAQAQSAAAGAEQRRRRRLVGLLVAQPSPLPTAVEDAAKAARWPLPVRLAAVAASDDDPERLARRIGRGAIAASVGALACVLVPDPEAPGTRSALVGALEDRAGALGPAVPWGQAARSFARAADAHRLQQERIVEPTGLVVAEERLADLVVHQDSELLNELAARRLAGLEALAPGARARLRTTLEAWLAHQGQIVRVAEALHVHSQTVRYRLEQLRAVLGSALESPQGRFELELALRAPDGDAGGAGETAAPL